MLQARGMQTSTDQRHLHAILTAYASDMLDVLGSGVSYGEWWKTSLWFETYLYQQQLPIVMLDSEHEFKFYVKLFSCLSKKQMYLWITVAEQGALRNYYIAVHFGR